jgi:putative membrane protein
VTLSLRNLRLLVLGAWSAFFAYLWISGDVLLYLGPRTAWVVTFGAITLSATTVAYFALSAGDGERGISPGEAVGLASILAPILLVMMLSNASLGALAASQKLAARGVDLDSLAEALARDAAPLTFFEVKAASDNPEEAAKLDIRPGQQVSLTGFVMQAAGSPSGAFQLGRFYITCCVADAIPVWVPVYPTIAKGDFPKDAWLTVRGAIAERNGKLVIDAEQIERISQPSHPYLPWPVGAV